MFEEAHILKEKVIKNSDKKGVNLKDYPTPLNDW
jgi:hypothetical protein